MLMAGFVDEYQKIAASKGEAGYQQTRKGRRPIRAHNLLKKADAAKAEAAKAVGGGLKGLLGRLWGSKARNPLLIAGAGAAGMKGIEEGLVEPLQYASRAREMGAQF